jgi:hypothetical protein
MRAFGGTSFFLDGGTLCVQFFQELGLDVAAADDGDVQA